jgi:hypothetical protein
MYPDSNFRTFLISAFKAKGGILIVADTTTGNFCLTRLGNALQAFSDCSNLKINVLEEAKKFASFVGSGKPMGEFVKLENNASDLSDKIIQRLTAPECICEAMIFYDELMSFPEFTCHTSAAEDLERIYKGIFQ